jgi:hypothetical protein
MGIKLSAKFARQESEEARLARIARKRIPPDRIATIRRMLGVLDPEPQRREHPSEVPSAVAPSPFRCISGGTGGQAMPDQRSRAQDQFGCVVRPARS